MSPERIAKLALASIDGIGRSRFARLLREFGTADAVLAANITALLTVPRISFSLAKRIIDARHRLDVVARRWSSLEEIGCRVQFCDEPDYPEPLQSLRNAPAMLITLGARRHFPNDAVGIVGTRAPSPDAARVAYDVGRLARERGATVVSGLARGIDAKAHKGALAADNDEPTPATIAVLGCALNSLHPAENAELADDIGEHGALATERLSGSARPSWLVQRNRILSGLSHRVLVVEFHEAKDGSLHTARFALEQGRPVAVWKRWREDDERAIRQMLARRGAACRPLTLYRARPSSSTGSTGRPMEALGSQSRRYCSSPGHTRSVTKRGFGPSCGLSTPSTVASSGSHARYSGRCARKGLRWPGLCATILRCGLGRDAHGTRCVPDGFRELTFYHGPCIFSLHAAAGLLDFRRFDGGPVSGSAVSEHDGAQRIFMRLC